MLTYVNKCQTISLDVYPIELAYIDVISLIKFLKYSGTFWNTAIVLRRPVTLTHSLLEQEGL